MIYLETERLILRDYREDDFEEYYRLKSDPKTMYYLQDIQRKLLSGFYNLHLLKIMYSEYQQGV